MPQTTPYSSKFNPGTAYSHRQPVEENYGGLHYRDNKLACVWLSGSPDTALGPYCGLLPWRKYTQPLYFPMIIIIISPCTGNVKFDWRLMFLFQRSYIFTFLLSSRLFLHPFELMSRVCYLCVDHHRVGDPQMDKVRVILGVDSMTKMLYHHMSIFTSQYCYLGWKCNSDVLHNHVVMSGFG